MKPLQMIEEMKRLKSQGFAVHWLHPMSKAPIGDGWAKREPLSAENLERTYVAGNNIGVLLGTPISGGFLGVIDGDVKSTDPKHLSEMHAKLDELFPGVRARAPIVVSGRGNGSLHAYVKTGKLLRGKKLAQSKNHVKVRMPSVTASQKDKQALSADEIRAGWRMRAAWEIEFLGDGRQVVLPPSLHPDSKKPYKAIGGGVEAGAIPTIEIDAIEAVKGPVGAKSAPFTAVDYDLISLDSKIADMIECGNGVDDRSSAAFLVCLAMLREGYSDNEILSCLTDRDNFLSSVGYDHAKTDDRGRAAIWLSKYTLAKAKLALDPVMKFSDDLADPVSALSETEILAMHDELTTLRDWRLGLARTQNEYKVKCIPSNILLILENCVEGNLFESNAFSKAQIFGCKTPWGAAAGKELTDEDVIDLKFWLDENYNISPSVNILNEVIMFMAKRNTFHPVRDYLKNLVWDGVPRVSTWLKDHLEAQAPEPYLSQVSTKVLVAMVARIMSPGVKFDQVLILEGRQGARKSTSLEALAGYEWFSDAHLNLADKDSVLAMRNVWLMEIGELGSLHRSEVNQVKEFFSRRFDQIRPPYGKRTEKIDRQCVFVGTTNMEEFLKDETGNRRFWPVKVGECDADAIRSVRDLLFAEAMVRWSEGEALYLDDAEALKQSEGEQKERMVSDIWVEKFQNFLAKEQDDCNAQFDKIKFTMAEAFSDNGPFAKERDDKFSQMRAGDAMKRAGYFKARAYGKDKIQRVYWMPK